MTQCPVWFLFDAMRDQGEPLRLGMAPQSIDRGPNESTRLPSSGIAGCFLSSNQNCINA